MPISTDTIWDAKGDLVAGTGADAAARLAVTTVAGQELVKDSAASAGVAWAPAYWQFGLPSGVIAETTPRQLLNYGNEPLLTSGKLYLASIYLPKDAVITSISFTASTTGAGTPLNQWFALYDSSLALLRQTLDDTTTAWGTGVTKTLNLTSTYTTTASGMFYLGIMVKATTVPTLRAEDIHTNIDIVGLAPILYGTTNNTGLTDTAPNPATGLTVTTADAMPYGYCS